MNKELERLNDEKTRNEAKMRQLKNEIKAMEAAEKGLLRKQRNRRIFTRGGMLEAFLLKPLLLTDKQVHELLLTAFRQPAVDALLKAMIQNAGKEDTGDETRCNYTPVSRCSCVYKVVGFSQAPITGASPCAVPATLF